MHTLTPLSRALTPHAHEMIIINTAYDYEQYEYLYLLDRMAKGGR